MLLCGISPSVLSPHGLMFKDPFSPENTQKLDDAWLRYFKKNITRMGRKGILAENEIHPTKPRNRRNRDQPSLEAGGEVGAGAGEISRAGSRVGTVAGAGAGGGLLPPSSGGQEQGGRRRSVSRSSRGREELRSSVGEGKKAIKGVTMNLAGQSVMGITPGYKINYIKSVRESSHFSY